MNSLVGGRGAKPRLLHHRHNYRGELVPYNDCNPCHNLWAGDSFLKRYFPINRWRCLESETLQAGTLATYVHTNLTSGVFCDLLLLLITQNCYCHSKVQVHFWGKIKRSYIRKYNDNTIKCILCKLIFIEKLLLNIEVEPVEFLNFDFDIHNVW